MKKYTAEEIIYLQENYPHISSSAIAKNLGRPLSGIYGLAYKLGLKKSEVYLQTAESGRLTKGIVIGYNTFFKPGHIPANKGKKMTAEQYAKAAPTMFKKGNASHNKLPIGYEVIDRDGYHKIKIADPNVWAFKHRLIYEQHYNVTIPKGHKCIFIDGNKNNFDISNLILEDNGTAMMRNTIHRYPEDLKQVIKIHSKLTKTIKNHEKNTNS